MAAAISYFLGIAYSPDEKGNIEPGRFPLSLFSMSSRASFKVILPSKISLAA